MEENGLESNKELLNKIRLLENEVKNLTNFIENINFSKIEIVRSDNQNYDKSTNLLRSDAAQENTYLFLKIILESMPFPVFIKDEEGKYVLINALEAKLFGLNENEVLGKDDSHFLKDAYELELVKKTDQQVLTGKKGIELPEQNFSLPNGTTYVFKTHKMPFINPITGRPNILGFSVDVSDTVSLNHLKKIMIMTSNPYL